MTPFFAMAGERALSRDADSTLPAVQRALHVLMPLLLAKGPPPALPHHQHHPNPNRNALKPALPHHTLSNA